MNVEETSSKPDHEAIYALSTLDHLYDLVGVTMGWLVEGTVDPNTLAGAMDRVVFKWPLLAGKLECTGSGNRRRYHIRVPLGTCPEGYERYTVTSTQSKFPLANYVTLPMPLVSEYPPYTLFKHSQAPHLTSNWIQGNRALLHWHVTHFEEGDKTFSCIGLTFPHACFDGLGIASVIHAVEAELQRKSWPDPLVLKPGYNDNLMEAKFQQAAESEKEVLTKTSYTALSYVSMWWLVSFFFWNVWQHVWHQSRKQIFLFPPNALIKLVEDTRQASAALGHNDVRLTRGDVLAAFLFKTVFSDEDNPEKTVHLYSLASLRRFFDGALTAYPHNCTLPLSLPIYTVGQLKAISLPELSYQLAQGRMAFTISEPLQTWDTVRRNADRKDMPLLLMNSVDEDLNFSNMCIANIVNIDWSGTGAGRTICRYKVNLIRPMVGVSNSMTAAGYLDDGTLVLDINVKQTRLVRLQDEIERLVRESNVMM